MCQTLQTRTEFFDKSSGDSARKSRTIVRLFLVQKGCVCSGGLWKWMLFLTSPKKKSAPRTRSWKLLMASSLSLKSMCASLYSPTSTCVYFIITRYFPPNVFTISTKLALKPCACDVIGCTILVVMAMQSAVRSMNQFLF
ncbi:MAG: hypothetical protein RJB13_1731 [Pseudomonadota bacterium]